MSGTFNMEKIISNLKEKRSIFVSEADLQLELAWIIKNTSMISSDLGMNRR